MINWQLKPRMTSVNGWGCLLAAMLLLAGNVSAADSPIRSLDVTYDGETYVLNSVMFAPVAQAVAWDVLTDFDHQAKWVPNVSESKVLKREDDSMTIEQRGMAKYGALSFPYTTERKIEMKPLVTIHSIQLEGSLRRVESMMTLEPEGKGTRLNYHLEIVPSGLATALLSKHFIEHQISEQFAAIVEEMVHRAQ